MSAYICEALHIAYIAQYAAAGGKILASDVGRVARQLGMANCLSIIERYGNEAVAEMSGYSCPIEYLDACEDFARTACWEAFYPEQVINSIECYQYQSCDFDGWEDHLMCRLTNSLIVHAGECAKATDYIKHKKRRASDGDPIPEPIWGAPEPLRID
jgi:hypothetical protein